MKKRHQELVDGYCSGLLSDAEFDELESALRESPSLRETLLEYRALESALQVVAAAETVRRPHVTEIGFFGRWRVPLFAAAATIALLLTAATVFLVREDRIQNLENPQLDHGVAVLTRTLEAEWLGEKHPEAGDSILPGRWRLASGSAELEFYNGASVILQGPADLEIQSANGGILHAGKLRAQVPEHAHGFTITSRDVELVDLGTAFGMDVDETAGTAVHVFEGSVELFEPTSRQAGEAGSVLVAGEGLRMSYGSDSSELAIAPSSFLSPTELNRRSKDSLEMKYSNWRKEFEASLDDPRLVARYGFERKSEYSRSLMNASFNNEPGMVGSIIGARWSYGRWPGKHALDFKRPGDRVRLTIPGGYESMTLAAWVRVDGFDYEFNSLLLSDGWDRLGAVPWQIHKKGFISLAVWNGAVESRNNSIADFVFEPSDFGRWMHLAAVYDGANGIVRHYRNAELIGEVTVSPTVPLHIGDALIGNWSPPPEDLSQIRNFNGRMDDMAIFSEALSSSEIQDLYSSGNE